MGYIPIYVYQTNDTPWIPYIDVFVNEVGYMTDVDLLQDLLFYLHHNVSLAELQLREERIAFLRDTHFTMDGVLGNQIQQFMLGNIKKNYIDNSSTSDLQCRSVPLTVTGER